MLTLAFWLLLILAAWCYAGYPLAMLALARVSPRPWRPGRLSSSISVVVPVRNGADLIQRRLENLLSQDSGGEELEILVVCNGCTDRTEEIAARSAAADPRVRVIVSAAEHGKAGALNVAAAAAAGDLLVFADVRQRFAPKAIRRLIAPFADEHVGAVTGRLTIERTRAPAVQGMGLYWGGEARLRQAESDTGSVVGVTGAIYAIRRHLFPHLPANLILDDLYVPMRVMLASWRVVQVPDALAFDTPSRGTRLEYARRRRTMVGNLQLLRLMPELLLPWQNPVFARFLSHKVLRLGTPFLFVTMLGLSAVLPGAFYRTFFWGEVSAYLAGGLGLILRVRILALPAAFVMMHGAILSAFVNWRQDAMGVWAAGDTPAGSPPAAEGGTAALEPGRRR